MSILCVKIHMTMFEYVMEHNSHFVGEMIIENYFQRGGLVSW